MSRRVNLHPIGYVMSIFLYIRWWKGVMVLRRRWSDLTHFFAVGPRLGYIPSIYVAEDVGRTSYWSPWGSMSAMVWEGREEDLKNCCRQIGVQKNEKSHTPLEKATAKPSTICVGIYHILWLHAPNHVTQSQQPQNGDGIKNLSHLNYHRILVFFF